MVLALLAGYLYPRARILTLLYSNAPGRLQPVNNLPNAEIRFQDVVRNCEDAYIDRAAGFVLLSCDPGRDRWNTVMVSNDRPRPGRCRDDADHAPIQGNFENPNAPEDTGIYLYRYADGSSAAPQKLSLLDFPVDAANFHPLGIEYDADRHLLFVTNHAEAGSRLEVFRLFPDETAATHVRSISHPLLHTPNSIAVLGENELLVTNDHYFRRRAQPALALLETYLAAPGGNVAHVTLPAAADQPANVTVLAHVGFANGVVLLNDTMFAVASTSAALFHLYTAPSGLRAGLKDVTLAATIPLPFLPDNLSVDDHGKLLLAGHPFVPTVDFVVHNNARCVAPVSEEEAQGCETKAPSWIAEWSAESGLRSLYVGEGFATSTTAVRDARRGFGLAVGLYAPGLLTWTEK